MGEFYLYESMLFLLCEKKHTKKSTTFSSQQLHILYLLFL